MPTPADRFKEQVHKAHEQGILAYVNAVTSTKALVDADAEEHSLAPGEHKFKPIGLTPEKFQQYEAEARLLIYGTPEKPGIDQQLLLAKDVDEVKAVIKEASEHFRKAGFFTAWEFARAYVMSFNKSLKASSHEYAEAMRDENTIGHGIPRPRRS